MTRSHSTRPVVVAALALAALTSACAPSLALRRAQVMQPGEMEVLASPELSTTTAAVTSSSPLGASSSPAALFGSFGSSTFEASFRTGIAENTDLQLRFDPNILPEVSIGRQLVGDATRDGFALTFTSGVKPSFTTNPLTGAQLGVAVPLELLVDQPITPRLIYTGGVRLTTSGSFPFGAPAGLDVPATFSFTPGVVSAVQLKIAHGFFIQPELGLSTTLSSAPQPKPIFGAPATPSIVPVTMSMGLTAGGDFDLLGRADDDCAGR